MKATDSSAPEPIRRILRPSRAIWLTAALLMVAGCGSDSNPVTPDPDPDPAAATGSVSVTTIWNGNQPDPDGYLVRMNGSDTPIEVSETSLLTDIPVGTHTVELTGIASNCEVTNGTTQTVTVTDGGTSVAVFSVSCVTALRDQILFVSDRDTDGDLFLMNPDGSGVVRLTTSPPGTGTSTGAVSLDGRAIVYSFYNGTGTEIWAMDADGSNKRRLSDDGQEPTWHPDGTRVLFASNRTGDFDLYSINADGSGLQNLTNSAQANESYPVWSPDGTRIAFLSEVQVSERDVWTMSSTGSGLTNVTNAPAWMVGVAWSPDGTKLAYSSNRPRPIDILPADDLEIHVINVDGTNDRYLTSNTVADALPTWSADGNYIAYIREMTPQDFDVFVMTSLGQDDVNITSHGAIDYIFTQSWCWAR